MKRNLVHIGLFGLALTWSSGLIAAPAQGDEPLNLANALGKVLDRVWSEAPERALTDGREAEAQALQRHADALLPQAPSLALSAQAGSYAHGDPSGTYSELIGGVELPLWRPGQREILQRIAQGTQDLAEAERAALRLALAGLLREAGWDVLLAETRVQGLRRALDEVRTAQKKMQRMVVLGERSRVDAVQLGAEAADVAQQHAAAEAALQHATLAWRSLSRQHALPGQWRETLVGERPIELHPVALAARAAWQRAGHERQKAGAETEGAPVLGVGARQDRTPGAETLNAVVMTLSMPLPWASARAATEAPLRYAELEAEVAFNKTLRRLQLEREAARAALQGARQQAGLAEERMQLEQESLRLAERQVAEGQMDALDFVTVLRRVREAVLAAEMARIEVERAVSRVNQAEGVV
ncbi:MAG: TolC family protein [Pseudomonadota bacterium]